MFKRQRVRSSVVAVGVECTCDATLLNNNFMFPVG
jgi:hypothetical protein